MVSRRPARRWIAALVSATLVTGLTVAVVPAQSVSASPVPAVRAADDQPTTVTSRPDLVSARIAAVSQGSPIEVTSLEDEYSTTYVNPDGTETTDTSQTPIRVMQNGAWTPVDYSLEHIDGGWQPKASPVPVVFSDGADSDAADIGNGAKEVDLSWDVTLPKPTIDGASATYDLGGGESLVLTATSTGYEQSLVLQQAPTSLPHIKLPLDTSDLTMQSDGSGGFLFQNASGANVYQMPGPVMYGAAIDPATEEPTQSQPVSANLVQTDNGPQLDLNPSLSWLQDPSTTYPVTIDPSISITGSGDTYIQDNVTTSQASSIYLHAGDLGGHAARSFLMFNGVSKLAGTDVTSATLKLWNNGANNCTPAQMNVYALTSSFAYTHTWSDPKPTWTTTDAGSKTFANGVGSCPNAEVDIPIAKIVQDWANGQTNDGLQLSGTETAGSQGWTFCSMNPNTTGGTSCETSNNHQPTLSVTYSSYPATPASGTMAVYPCASACGGTGSSTALTDTTTPQLAANVSDADGGAISAQFQVFSGTIANPGSTVLASGTSSTTSGGTATWNVPASASLTSGSSYVFHVRGVNGPATGPYSGYFAFQIDTTPPAAPTLNSSQLSWGQWANPNSGTVSWSSSSDAAQYDWTLNGSGGGVTQGTTGSRSITGLKNGINTITVLAIDKAGNMSAGTTETFGVGSPAIATPEENDNTQKDVTLSSPTSQNGLPTPGYVTYEWRMGSTGSFAPVPTGDLAPIGSAPNVSSWPIDSTGSYTWNVAHTAGLDGNVQVEGCYGSSSTTISSSCQPTPIDVEVDADAFQAADATQQIGPGTLADLTGDFNIDATDVDTLGEFLSRSLTTLAPASANSSLSGVFGPGWTASLSGPSNGAAGDTVNYQPSNGLVTLTEANGSQTDFANPVASGGVTTYTDPDDSNQTVAYSDFGQPQLWYTDASGGDPVVTYWSGGTASTWQPAEVVENNSTSQNVAGYFYYPSSSPYSGLLEGITTPSAPNIDCSTLAKATSVEGCRTMLLDYTTLNGSGSSQIRLSEVDIAAWNPAAATPGIVTTAVADYSYNSGGQLSAEWDPRISPALKTSYTYDTNDRLATLTPPGLATWSFSYNSSGQLTTVSRPDPSGKAAVTTIVYGLPLAGSGLPDLGTDSNGPSSWGQANDLPVRGSGMAVFPPSHQPAGTDPADVSSTDWPYAALTYMDVNGQDVDDATYDDGAWQINSTQYDSYGNQIWSLDEQGRDQALNPTSNTDPFVAAQSTSALRAGLLASTSTYSADGENDLSDLGPMHPVTVTVSGQPTVVDARSHTVTCYDDSGATCSSETIPTDAPPGLAMTTTTSVQDASGTDYNPQTTTNSYEAVDGGASGWDIGEPTAVTDPGGLTTTTGYNADGTTAEVDQPSTSNSTNARSQLTSYYTAPASGSGDNNASCVDAAWVGQVCETSTKSSSAALPVTTYTYDMWGDQLTKTQTYGTGASAVVRTYTSTYDAAGRQLTSSIAVSPDNAGGTDVPVVNYAYDQSSGLPTTTSTGNGSSTVSLSTGYDSLGLVTSYTDATNDTSTTNYDIDGRISTFYDGKGTTTYGYGQDSGDQNEILTENISAGGSPSQFSASYDADGDLTSETYPNGLVASSIFDNDGNQTALDYSMNGVAWLNFNQAYNAQDEVVQQSSPESNQSFAYDGSDRLTQVQDTDNSTGTALCTTRQYSYDQDSNRTKLLSYPDSGSGCSTSTSDAETDYSYDATDRLTSDTAGTYSYDGLGRATTIPAGDSSGTGVAVSTTGPVSLSYDSNDMIASESQGSSTESFTLDPDQNRVASETLGGTTTTNHYSDDSDDAAWTSTDASHWSENDLGPDGLLQAIVNQTGQVALQLKNLHGDIVASCADDPNATSVSSYVEFTEFGAPRVAAAAPTNGWLGSQQRSASMLGGAISMGVRSYSTATGRFDSTDPVLNGNANAYNYPDDPVNENDTSGDRCAFFKTKYTLEAFGGYVDNSAELDTHWCYNSWQVLSVSSKIRWYTAFDAEQEFDCEMYEFHPKSYGGHGRWGEFVLLAMVGFEVNTGGRYGNSGFYACVKQRLFYGGRHEGHTWVSGFTSFVGNSGGC